MAEINSSDVIKLRKLTGAGMMDCKVALQEAAGNMEEAINIIRKKGQAVANKRSDREAKEGVAIATTLSDNTRGAFVILNCETDFVAKNNEFVDFARKILDSAMESNCESLDSLMQQKIDGTTIADLVMEKLGIIGEKIELSEYQKLEAAHVVSYIHPGNKLVSLVGFNKTGLDDQLYRDIAMQVAAMDPVSVDKDNVPEKVIEQEKEIGREQARMEGKPENIIEKIAEGKLLKFLKENTLLNQDFIKDSKKSVRQYLQEIDKDFTVIEFKRFSIK